MSVQRGGEAKETRRTDGAATGGNWESAPHPSGVVSVGYPERAGGRVEGERGAVGSVVPSSPPPAPLCVGDPVAVHLASCESPAQHKRVVVGGVIAEVYPDGAGRALMEDGSSFELCPWFTSNCPNASYAYTEEGEAA